MSSANPGDEFFEQILGLPNFPGDPSVEAIGGGGTASGGGMAPPPPPMMLLLGSGDAFGMGVGVGGGGGGYHAGTVFPLGLSLELEGRGGGGGSGGGCLKAEEGGSGSAAAAAAAAKRFHDGVVDGRGFAVKNVFHGQPVPNTLPVAPHPPAIRPRVRARRGQATDPHSIAERLRRERIAERIRQLQDLVPSVNKTDRAAMLDEIVDYVKFLRLQVKVLSMSRLGGAGAVAPLVTDNPLPSVEEEGGEGERNQPAWEKWSNDRTERQVAKLMEENVGAAMQFLQSKALCIVPISLATAIYQSQPPDTSSLVVDLELSKEMFSEFKNHLLNHSSADLGLDLSVSVLTTGYWPSINSANLNLPEEMAFLNLQLHFLSQEKPLRFFQEFFRSKRQHCCLSWIFSFGNCVLIGQFDRKTIEMVLSTYQAAVVLLFNDADRLSNDEILAQRKLPEVELVRVLHSLSCGKYKILNKDPSTKTVLPTDVFEFNPSFSDRMTRIKVPLPLVEDRKKVILDVNRDRRYAIDASLVRIMKMRKVLNHQQLVAECTEQMRHVFKPDVRTIKMWIEDLIFRYYLERDKENKQLVWYMA